MKHILYKTTNKITNKIYVGIHSTENVDDGYLGSGHFLLQSIEKYGKDSFEVTILKECDTREELCEAERLMVDDAFISRGDTYNLITGGIGGALGEANGMYGKTHTQEVKDIISKVHKGKKVNHKTLEAIKENGKLGHKAWKGSKHTEETKAKVRKTMTGKIYSEERRQKMSEGWAKRRLMKQSKVQVISY